MDTLDTDLGRDVLKSCSIKHNLLYDPTYCLSIQYPYPAKHIIDIDSCILFAKIVFHNDISLIDKRTVISNEPIDRYCINAFPCPTLSICDELLKKVGYNPMWHFYIVAWYILNHSLPPNLYVSSYHLKLAKLINIPIKSDISLHTVYEWSYIRANIIKYEFSEENIDTDNEGSTLFTYKDTDREWEEEDIVEFETRRWLISF